MFEIGARLKEERVRLALNQSQFAEAVGVTKNSQSNYESGLRKPDSEYLAKAASISVDVLYVLTGKRAADPIPLTQEEAALLDNFRDLSEVGKEAVKATTNALSQAKGDQADVA